MNWKLPCALLGLVLVLNMNAIAQCTWCYTISEVCCDGDTSNSDIQIPCATSEIWVYFDYSSLDRVYVDIINLDTGLTIAFKELNCDCDRRKLWQGTLAANTNLSFRAYCHNCTGEECALGNSHVKFFTPSSNTCAPNCSGS